MGDEDEQLDARMKGYVAACREKALVRARTAARRQFERDWKQVPSGRVSWLPNWRLLTFQHPALALGAVTGLVLVIGFLLLPKILSRPVVLAMALPTLKGNPPLSPGRWVSASVTVSVDWKAKTIRIPLVTGGELTGELREPQAPIAGTPPVPYLFDVIGLKAPAARNELTGSGQLVVMPKDASTAKAELSAAEILWVKLNLTLRADGQEDLVYRVFGTP